MYNLYKKNPLNFALVWIGIYCVVQSLSNGISAKVGIPKSANAVLALLQSAYLLYWLHKKELMRDFRLVKPTQPPKNMLFYLPLLLISTFGLWSGVRRNLGPAALVFHILLMLNVGFLEELIFRGFLLEALRKSSMKTAIVISSLTFGVGHIINLFNGNGGSLSAVLFQIVFAVLMGFLFVMVYLRSGSLIPCILSHQCINILSAFASRPRNRLALIGIEIALVLLYLLILRKTVPIQGTGKEGQRVTQG